MSQEVQIDTPPGRRQLEELRAALPVLVEVRFTRCARSSDWHVCSTDEELDALIERVAPGHLLIAVPVDRLDQRGWTQLRT
jgi:hypothetical protein